MESRTLLPRSIPDSGFADPVSPCASHRSGRPWPQLITELLLAAVLVPVLATGASAQNTFVYVHDDDPSGNIICGLLVHPNGGLSPISGSPFSTGGLGAGDGLFGASELGIATTSGFLYAANAGSGDVSGFSINPVTGFLTPVPGSPFPATGFSEVGYSLAVSPNDRFLFCANSDTGSISAFSITAKGSLVPVPGSPFLSNTSVDGLKVSPNGKFLASALKNAGPNGSVGMWAIGSNGGLTSVTGSPFAGADPVLGGAVIASIDINSESNLLFASLAMFGAGPTIVNVFSIGSSGALSPIAGSPFVLGAAPVNSSCLSGDGRFLFLSSSGPSDDISGSVSVLSIGANGSLSESPGSPFANADSFQTGSLAIGAAGKVLFVANDNNSISVFNLAINGTLTMVTGSPFSTGAGGLGFESLAVFTGTFDICMRDNTTGDVFTFNSKTGAYQYTRCKDGFTISGIGTVTNVSGVLTLTVSESNLKIRASFNTGQLTGSATITLEIAQGVWQTDSIHDTTSDGTGCSCGQ
jgi:6-phosphogluconolactonase